MTTIKKTPILSIETTFDKLIQLPRDTAEERSLHAEMAWRGLQDLVPLINLLKNGEASAGAQELAADLLTKATTKTLPNTRKNLLLDNHIVMAYLLCLNNGVRKIEAMELIREKFNFADRKSVEQRIYGTGKKDRAQRKAFIENLARDWMHRALEILQSSYVRKKL